MDISGFEFAFCAHWMNAYEGAVPPGAIVAGHQNGQIMYVCRAWHDGELLPGALLCNI